MWNYRVVRKRNSFIDPESQKENIGYTYGIHEAYYDENGYVGAVTQESVAPFGENVQELRHSWVMMAEAFGQPILDFDNIPEPGYDRKKDSIFSVLDERLKDIQEGNEVLIPWEDVKKNLEDKWGPFDKEAYEKEIEEERLEKEKIHNEVFIGTKTLKELIHKLYTEYRKSIDLDKAQNPWKYETDDA